MPLLQIAAKPARIPREAKHTARDLPRNHRVMNRGEKGYNGRLQERADSWTPANRSAGVRILDTATDKANDLLEAKARRRKSDRTMGRTITGLGGGMAVLYGGLTPIGRHNFKRETEKTNQKNAAMRAKYGIASKLWNPSQTFHHADPGLKHVPRSRLGLRRKQGYKIHSMESKPGRIEQFGHWLNDDKSGTRAELALSGATLGGMGIGIGTLAAGTHGPRKKLNEAKAERAKLLRQTKKQRSGQVVKMNRLEVARHFGSPRKAAATLKSNPQLLAFGGAGAIAAGGAATTRHKEDHRRTASAGMLGAVGGQAAYQGGMFASNARANAKHDVVYKDPKKRRGYNDPAHKKVLEGHKARNGLKNPDAPSDYKNFYRTIGLGEAPGKEIPGARHLRINAQLATGRRGMAVGGAASAAGSIGAMGVSRHRQRKQLASKAVKPTEYQPGQPLERYSAERRRRGVVAEGAAYGAAATGAGLGATSLGNAKIAGTRVGQHTLSQAQHRLERAGHPGAKQIEQVKRVGQWAAKRPRRTAAGVAGLSLASAGLGIAARLRGNEEAGISQGIGRIKAGESYAATQRRVIASKGMVRTVLMASDADLNNPNIRRGLDIANRHGKKVVGGTLVGSGSVAAYASARGSSNRHKQAQQLRSQVGKLYVRDRQVSVVHAAETGAGLAVGAWGLGHSKMLGRALARGVKQAESKQNGYAVEALQRAQAAQGLLARHTARGERQLRQIRAVDEAVQRVPAAIRPEVATAAGMLLVAQGHPVRRDTYHPVNLRVRGGF